MSITSPIAKQSSKLQPNTSVRCLIFDYGNTLAGQADNWRMTPEAVKLIHELALIPGLRLAVLSNAGQVNKDSRQGLRNLLHNAGVLHLFDVVLSLYREGEMKPCPNAWLRVLHCLEVGANKAIMFGDAEADRGSEQAGVRYVFLKYDDPNFRDIVFNAYSNHNRDDTENR